MTTRCPICTGVMAEEAQLCPSCGHAPSVRCPSCGAQRLRSQRTCPACGKGWVTATPEPVLVGSRTAEENATSPSVYRQLATGETPLPLWSPDEEVEEEEPAGTLPVGSELWGRWLGAGVALVVAVLAIFGVVRVFNSDEPTGGAPTGAGATTTTSPSPATTVAAATTTTGAATTTTTAATTTTTFVPIEPVGESIPLGDLALTAVAIEPVAFGIPFEEALGRLVATFDQPESLSPPVESSGEMGTCPGSFFRVAEWGRLRVVGVRDGDTDIFAGYRMDLRYDEFAQPGIQTLSGVGLGSTVAELEATYAGFDLRLLPDPDAGPTFELHNTAGSLLLWGPLSSLEPTGTVVGIYSPDPCSLP